MASTILEEIIAYKKIEVEEASKIATLRDLEQLLPEADPVRGFAAAMADKAGQGKAAIIAEIKKASPSRGIIRPDFRPADHASDYEENGATCLSILTDNKYFQGSTDDLQAGRAACNIPVIRKDFMIEPYQIAESRALGADCILLIVAALQQSQMLELAAYANEIGIDILVEVHNPQELERAMEVKTSLIGINNRDLHTFTTSLQTTLDLAREIPNDKIVITESGIHSVADVKLMIDNDIYGFLVGESFMRSAQPGAKLQELFANYA